jgi:hypothetical protein
MLVGPSWKGTLTYLDYTSKKLTTIKSTLLVSKSPKKERVWTFSIGYTDEPDKNGGDDRELSRDGKTFAGQSVIERTVGTDGTLKIVTEEEGEDDHQPARFRFTYRISKHEFSLRKLVRFKSGGDFFERHIYRWKREATSKSIGPTVGLKPAILGSLQEAPTLYRVTTESSPSHSRLGNDSVEHGIDLGILSRAKRSQRMVDEPAFCFDDSTLRSI